MCGIAGEAGLHNEGTFNCDAVLDDSTSRVQEMIHSLSHRGPDEQSFWSDSFTDPPPREDYIDRFTVNLGMCRLSIIDREHGKQPFGDTCKVFFNGEIYNHKALRKSMNVWSEHKVNQTCCDSEVVAKEYELDKDDFPRELHGMYAIAVWDEKEEKLKLYRDRVGKKPLYYYHDEAKGVLLFASEIKAILSHPAYEKKINLAGIWQYLCMQYVPEPETAFKGIMCVPPGGSVIYDPKQNTKVVWEGKPIQAQDDKCLVTVDEYNDFITAKVRTAVHRRLESEVPIGVYLSGGVDSAIITALASEKIKDLHTFTMGFLLDTYDERGGAQLIADKFNTTHHVEVVESVDMTEMADEIIDQYDQPFGDCSAIPTMLLAKLSKKYITVALSGCGGDEAFGGYARYWQCPKPLEEYWKFMCVWPPTRRNDIWPQADYLGQSMPADDILPFLIAGGANSGMMLSDIRTYLLNDIIVKMERASMAASVEARCPFLDPDVLELGLSMPLDQKIGGGQGKLALKRAFAAMLPEQTLKAEKRGFSVPMNEWLREPKGMMLLSNTILAEGAFAELPGWNYNVVAQIVVAHYNHDVNVGHALWVLIMLEMWLKRHFR